MADTFKERLEKVTLRNMKVKHQKGKAHTMEKKIEVISQYLVLGNLRMVSATTGVDYGLIRQWKATPWWSELEQEIKATQNIEMDTKLSKIVERSLDAVADRLEHGDHFYDQKEGVIKRKPVAMRDAARVSVDMLSKRELLRGNATDRKETTQVGMNEQLKLLAAEFAKWVDPKKQEVIELVEVEDVYQPIDTTDSTLNEGMNRAIYEERQEGLQTGSGEIYVETGGSEEADGAERSSSGDGEEGLSPQG